MRMKGYSKICGALLAMVMVWGCMEKLPPGFAGSGTLEATEVTVSALVTGTILKLTRDEGDTVRANELLAFIDVEKLELQRAQLQASLKEIEAEKIAANAAIAQAADNMDYIEITYKRIQALYAQGSATRQQFDDISTQLSVARSGLTAAKAQIPVLEAKQTQVEAAIRVFDRQIADGTVYAPLNGTVVEKYVEPGEVAIQGQGLYKIADLENFWVKIYLAETDLGKMTLGQSVEVRVDAYAKPLRGKVTWVSPEAEFTPKNVQTKTARAELVYAVEVTLEKGVPELKIGMPAEVYFDD
jgi:HlyD family secretion protein